MKVALITFLWGNNGGGAAAVARMVASNLQAKGIEVVVITTQKEAQSHRYQENGITFYSFLPRNLYWVADKESQPAAKKMVWQTIDIWNPHSYRIVRTILEQERPDVVHVHKLRGLSPSIWTASRRAGIPHLIQTAHDFELLSPQGTLSGRVGNLIKEKAWFMRPYAMLRANLSKVVDVATAPSNFLLQPLLESGFFSRAKTSIVPNSHGHRREQLLRWRASAQSKPPCESDIVQLLYLGRLEEEKGVTLLCQAFKQSSKKNPNLYLNIAGWGPLEDHIREECAQHRQMQYLGPVFGVEKEGLLEEADLLVLPTLLPESFGNVIIEAFSHGKPVIASAIGAIPEIITDGKNGFLFPPGDINALENILQWVVRDRSLLLEMAPACWDAANHFTTDNVLNQYLELYQT